MPHPVSDPLCPGAAPVIGRANAGGSDRSVPASRRSLDGNCRRWARWAGAVATLLALGGCSGSAAGGAAEGRPLPTTSLDADPGLAHVHGLGVNPGDDRVYVATHFGLWRLNDSGGAERAGDYHHDFMGFTVVGEDHFVASGHPLLSDELPPLLGLLETTDAGRTWRSVSLLGAADFHALRAEHGLVYGWNSSDGAFMVSRDREEWQRRSTQPSLLDFVVDPDDPEHLLATVAESLEKLVLVRSTDGGRAWAPVDAPPRLARLAWGQIDRLWGVGMDGRVWRSADGGRSWDRAGRAPGAPEALVDTGTSLVVAAGGVVAESSDGGESWQQLAREE